MYIKPKLRKTKIVATIGPACDSLPILKKMIDAGMNVARLNLSHGTYQEHHERIKRIRQAARELDRQLAIMIDTKGIEIRTGLIEGNSVELLRGAAFALHTDGRVGDVSGVSVSYQTLPLEVVPGTPILLDDGAIELEVETVEGQIIHCRVVHGGILRHHKSLNLPNTELSVVSVAEETSETIRQELEFAAENDVDYIAASFVQYGDDIGKMREILAAKGMDIPIIAKIENKAGVTNLQSIVAAANGTMVARGDLGVELPLADVPATQKKIIRTTVMSGKPVITATQMLASMEYNPKPTRAEASDVANAILDGSSAIMLSGETAAGRYPVAAVQTMANLAIRAEASLKEYGYLQKILPHPSHAITEAIAQSAVRMVEQINASAIFSLTATGFTSRLISKHRPDCPILAVTASERVTRRLSMNWGVIPVLLSGDLSDDSTIETAIAKSRELGYLQAGDTVIATSGYSHQAGSTDLLRVITLGE